MMKNNSILGLTSYICKITICALLLSVLSAAALNVLTMRHLNAMDETHTQEQQANCLGQIPAGENCLEYHLAIINNVFLASPLKLFAEIFSVILFIALAFLRPRSFLEKIFRHILVRIRWLCLVSKRYFYLSLGFWLLLVEKRNPARNLLRRGFVFALAS